MSTFSRLPNHNRVPNCRRVHLIAVVLSTFVLTGCFPLGSKLGVARVVAERIDSDKHVTEQIVGVPTEHHWSLILTPEGPEPNYITSETWRFYLVGADRQRKSLNFLKERGGNANPWSLIAPISHSDLWVAIIYTGSYSRFEHGHHDYRVICFNAKGITTDTAFDYPEYGEFDFDFENHILTYKMRSGSRKFDPLANTNTKPH